MEIYDAVDALAALAHESRLGIFRYLVEIGPDGSPAGLIAEQFELPGATLSFHLNHLKRAGLIDARREGRLQIYSANYRAMTRLLGYLTENCCGGLACEPACGLDK